MVGSFGTQRWDGERKVALRDKYRTACITGGRPAPQCTITLFTAVIGKHAVFGRRAFGRPEHLYDMATTRPDGSQGQCVSGPNLPIIPHGLPNQ
jgi:hypothetical protein